MKVFFCFTPLYKHVGVQIKEINFAQCGQNIPGNNLLCANTDYHLKLVCFQCNFCHIYCGRLPKIPNGLNLKQQQQQTYFMKSFAH